MRIKSLFHILLSTAVAVSFAGCGDKPKEKEAAKDAHHDDHDHASKGPHGGGLIELGNEEYHAEIVHDDAAHKVTIYVLDNKAKNAVPIADADVKINVVSGGAPAQFVLPAAPQAGESGGKSSRFELVDEKLAEALDAKGAEARLKLNIAGSPYEGKITAHEHEHEK